MRCRLLFSCLAGALLLLAMVPQAGGQSLWGVHGPTATVTQMTGPPAGPCGYPTGPIIGGFFYALPWICPTAGFFPPMLPVGDVTVDMLTDHVWVSDGPFVTEYTKAGAVVSSFTNPLLAPLTGLGWGLSPVGVASGVLWLTDGTWAAAVTPPPPPGCAPPVFVVPPFLLIATPLPATDIDYDPGTGTLFLTSAAGLIANEVIGGGPGPFGVFPPPCIGGFLDGIAVDKSAGKRLYATDGVTVAYMFFGGAPAGATFYTTMPPCYPWAGAVPVSGLAFDAAPISYGAGANPGGMAAPPVAGALGEAVSPNASFALTLAGATPGGLAYLFIGTGAPCPAPLFWGCPILVAPIPVIIGPIPVPAGGGFTIMSAIPGGWGGMGVSAYLQWIVARPMPLGGYQTTQALELTLAAP